MKLPEKLLAFGYDEMEAIDSNGFYPSGAFDCDHDYRYFGPDGAIFGKPQKAD